MVLLLLEVMLLRRSDTCQELFLELRRIISHCNTLTVTVLMLCMRWFLERVFSDKCAFIHRVDDGSCTMVVLVCLVLKGIVLQESAGANRYLFAFLRLLILW